LRLQAPHPAATLAARGLKAREYRVVHPGMAGSALNWPVEYYRDLVEKLGTETTVVVTGTKMDSPFLEGLKELKEIRGCAGW